MRRYFDSLSDWHVVLALAICIAIVFGKSLTYEFTYADDTQLLVVNQEFLSDISNMPKLFTTEVFLSMSNPFLYYRPMLNVLFMLELQIAKDSTLLFHVTNMLLHFGCCVLMYLLFKHFQISKLVAGALALVFCIHPLNTSAIVWIPGRNDTLLTLFVLSSFLFFLRWLETGKKKLLIVHGIFFALALLTKESALALPILSVGYLFLVAKQRPKSTESILMFSLYVLVIAAWFILRNMVPKTFEIQQDVMALPVSLFQNIPVLLLYFGKIFLPFNLSIYPNLSDQSLLFGLLSGILFMLALILRPSSEMRYVYWGLGWFVLFLAPSLLIGIIFHEHRAYCSVVGIFLALSQFPFVRTFEVLKTSHIWGFIIVIVLLSLVSAFYSEQYKNRSAYVTSAFLSAPSVDVSYVGLAGTYIDENNDEAAEKVLRSGIARKQNMQIVHRMLADIYARRGEYRHAAEEYEKSLSIEPLHLYTYINYGKMQLQIGKVDDALTLWKTSVRINPEFLLGYYYLINCYLRSKNDPDSALIYVRKLQNHGVVVMPELMEAIEAHPLFRKNIEK